MTDCFIFLLCPCSTILASFQSLSSLFICKYILFSRFQITFTIIILNSFQIDSLLLPLFFFFFLCSFTWIFLCLLILFRLLCFGCPLQAESLWFLLIVESAPCGWGWTSDLSRFPGWGSLSLCSGGWSWISSLWSAKKCPVVNFGVLMGLAWLGSPSFNAQCCVPVLLEN